MPKSKHKIQIATPEEVAEYTEDTANAPEATEPNADRPEPDQEPKDELTVLREQLAEAQDKLLRAKAETQNVAKRAQQEHAAAIRYGNADMLRALLPVADDFERTLQAAADTDQIDVVVAGVKLVYDKLMKLLKDNAVEAIEATGRPFDPTEHSAVMQQESDEHEPGTVVQEAQRGYRYRDRVLRPSQVIVSKAKEPAKDADNQTN